MKKPRPKKLRITHIPPLYRVHYRDLEAFLAQVYGINDFSILKVAGITPGCHLEYLIQGVIPEYLQARVKKIRTGHRENLTLILEVLCVDGHIPPGHYIIDTHQEELPLEAYKRLLQQYLDPLHPECIRFKERHRVNGYFRKLARIIDRSLVEWLKKQPEHAGEPEKPPEHSHDGSWQSGHPGLT